MYENEKEADCSRCDCGEHQKEHFHHILKQAWDSLPDELKNEIRGLDQQKLAVMKDVKKWADQNNQKELSEVCENKSIKIQQRLDQYEF